MMAKFLVGLAEPRVPGSATETAERSGAQAAGSSSYVMYAIPVLILVGALYYQFVVNTPT